ncbi:MAG TPA: hypothetical protein VHW96_14140 [Solirubrobacteraceae bacterium]|jgi:hypothetical protein|nr:hypothetical protein [Solirubrobacteraceae bacterium]
MLGDQTVLECHHVHGPNWTETPDDVLAARLAPVWGRDSLVGYALQSHFTRRRQWPAELRAFPVVRLRTAAGVAGFLTGASRREAGATHERSAVRAADGTAAPAARDPW